MSAAIKNDRAYGARKDAGQEGLPSEGLDQKRVLINRRLYDHVGRIVADKCAPVQLGSFTFPSSLKLSDVLAELEHEAITILASEIRCFPEIAKALPLSFRQAVASGYPQNLTDLQRAALILATDETPPAQPYAEHFAMKAYSLIFALREGGQL